MTGGAWEYAGQVFASMVYFPAGLAVPDVALDKTVREKLSTFQTQKVVLMSLIDFADTINANTGPLLKTLGEIEREKSAADRCYIDMDLYEASRRMDAVIAKMEKMLDMAVRVKDQALLWIFVVEWFTIAGTSLLCGYVLYMLMIRRRLYREAVVTRLQR